MNAFVTGAGRGLGLELVRQLAARGATVHAGIRDGSRTELEAISGVRIHRLDVSDDASVAAVARELADTPLDLVINNAGVYGGAKQTIREVDFADAMRTYNTNALGALRVSLALLPNLRRGAGKKLAHITSGMGSIADNTSGAFYGYRMAKAALNMMSRSLSVDLRPDKIVSVVVNPGWVQTDMGGKNATTPVATSVAGILRVVEAANLERSGEFLDFKGGNYPW